MTTREAQNKAIVRRFVEEAINQSNETVFLVAWFEGKSIFRQNIHIPDLAGALRYFCQVA